MTRLEFVGVVGVFGYGGNAVGVIIRTHKINAEFAVPHNILVCVGSVGDILHDGKVTAFIPSETAP